MPLIGHDLEVVANTPRLLCVRAVHVEGPLCPARTDPLFSPGASRLPFPDIVTLIDYLLYKYEGHCYHMYSENPCHSFDNEDCCFQL